jgi:hypothetical protein
MMFTIRSSSYRDQIRLNELIEAPFKAVPGCTESTSFSHVFRQARIQHAQPRGQYATVGLGKEDRDPPPGTGELIPLGACDLGN